MLNNAIRIAFLVALSLPATLFAQSSFEDDFNCPNSQLFGTNSYTEGGTDLGYDSWQIDENDALPTDAYAENLLTTKLLTRPGSVFRILCDTEEL